MGENEYENAVSGGENQYVNAASGGENEYVNAVSGGENEYINANANGILWESDDENEYTNEPHNNVVSNTSFVPSGKVFTKNSKNYRSDEIHEIKYASIEVSSFQVFKFSNIQVFKCSSIQVEITNWLVTYFK